MAVPGVSYSYICRVETGRRQPSVKALRLLAPKLDVSVHWLERGEEDPSLELARLVLAQADGLLPKRARTLAQQVLRGER